MVVFYRKKKVVLNFFKVYVINDVHLESYIFALEMSMKC